MKKRIIIVTVSLLLLINMGVSVNAFAGESVYDTYIYGNRSETADGDPITIPSAYTVERVYNGADLGVDSLNGVKDIFYDKNGKIFLCDTAHDRILVFDKEFNLIHELKSFNNNGFDDTFSAPTGVYANEDLILVCDSKKSRILLFNQSDYSLSKQIGKPQIDSLKDENGEYNYTPTKAVMDRAGRLYVIAEGVNQGIIRLDAEGKFISFMGAPSVTPNIAELIWRKFATKAQKNRMQQYVPTEYDSLLIDNDGFLYATSITSSDNAFVRLNSKGENILSEITYFGDSSQDSYTDVYTPYFCDIAVDDSGTSYLLDAKQGKIYTYDTDGSLLYAFGSNSFQKGAFYSASAIEIIDDKMIVTDQNKNTITIFHQTEFGALISQANFLYRSGNNEEAKKVFSKIQMRCSSYLPATVSIAYIDSQNGVYGNALSQLKQIKDHKNYSLIYKKVRNNFLRKYFIYIVFCLAFMIFLFIVVKRFVKKSKLYLSLCKKELYQKYKYSKYTMFHPFDGFWDIKHEGKGNIKSATLILVIFTLLYGIRAQFSGYAVTKTVSNEVNALFSCSMVLLPLSFWVISNWCLTTLMDGKGSIKDIYITTCYSLKPYVVLSVPLLILSLVLTSQEAIFYNVLDSVCLIWVLGLIFFGMITIHDYSLSKGILTALLSLVGICLIIFLLLLIISIAQNCLGFAIDLYKEGSLRLYE